MHETAFTQSTKILRTKFLQADITAGVFQISVDSLILSSTNLCISWYTTYKLVLMNSFVIIETPIHMMVHQWTLDKKFADISLTLSPEHNYGIEPQYYKHVCV